MHKIGGSHNIYYRDCPTYKFDFEVVPLRSIHGLTLCEVRQEAHQQGFSPTTYSDAALHSAPPPSSQDASTSPFINYYLPPNQICL